MYKFFGLIAVTIFVVGSAMFINSIADPLERNRSSNGWQVQLCFEKDGHKVYRFSDGYQNWRYYVVPTGEIIEEDLKKKSN